MASSRTSYDVVVLAGDIGGTNTNLALIGKKGGTFTLLMDRHYRTREEPSLLEPLGRFLGEAAREHGGMHPELCCISGAGPVAAGRIALTNAPWAIDAAAIESAFSIRTTLINDFTAVSYGVLLLDPANPEQITNLPHADGSLPLPQPGGVRLVVGAGTGLGVGYVVKVRNKLEAFPSEGGHVTLPVYDGESRGFQAWLELRYGFAAGAEAGVSGQGIGNIFSYLAELEPAGGKLSDTARGILESPEADRPAMVAQAASSDPLCSRSMDMFVKLFARVAADHTATFLPSGGVFLAGGIPAKNEERFLEGGRFMAMYERSYAKHIRAILASTPVMIVKDYSISLYGAANAAVELS
jgi:glucokinase